MENSDSKQQQDYKLSGNILVCGFCLMKELRKLRKTIEKGTEQIMSKITDFQTAVQASFDAVTTSLDNIVTDEANLAKQISDLQAQIAAGGSTLTPVDQAALDTLAANATALAAKTKGIADAVPDLPTPPTV
jgi:hypothetical protein